MDQVADVDIEADGVFKYVLIKLTRDRSDAGGSKVVVRGYSWADYHGEEVIAISEHFVYPQILFMWNGR